MTTVINSVISDGSEQANGSIKVTEIHTDDVGGVTKHRYTWLTGMPAPNSLLVVHAEKINSRSAKEESRALEDAPRIAAEAKAIAYLSGSDVSITLTDEEKRLILEAQL
jgi:hypothetical protein